MASIAKLVVSLGASTADFETDMARAGRISDREMKKMERQAEQLNATWNRNFMLAGAAVAAGIGLAIKSALDFEKAMAEVSTLVDGDVSDLAESVKKLSVEFGGMPVDEAKALYQIISAGASDAATQMEQLTVANKLAVGGVTDVATAADGLTSVFNAYAGTGLDVNRISDIMFETMRRGKTTIGELSGTVGNVSTIAAQTGVSFEELGASIATVTATGLSTSQAVDGLRGVLSAVLKQSDETKKSAKALGIEFDVNRLKAVGLVGVLEDIANSGATEEQLSKLVGRVEGLTNILATVRNDGEAFAENLRLIEGAAGATDIAVAKMADTASFKAAQARAAFETLKIEIGEKFLAAVSDMAGGFVTHLDTITNAVEVLAALITARVGVAMVASFATAAASVGGLAAAMAILGGPIGITVLALTAMSLAIVKLHPEMTDLERANRDLEKSINGVTDAWVKAASAAELVAKQTEIRQKWIKTDQELIKVQERLAKLRADAPDDLEKYHAEIKQLEREETKLLSTQGKAIGQLADMNKRLGDLAKGSSEAAEEVVEVVTVTEEVTKTVKEWSTRQAIANEIIQEASRYIDDLIQEKERLAAATQRVIDEIEPLTAAVRRENEQFETLDQALAAGLISHGRYVELVGELAEKIVMAETSMGGLAKESDVLSEAMLEGARILERQFNDLWIGILDGGYDVFDALEKGFKSMLANMLQSIFTTPLTDALTKALSPGGGGLGEIDRETILKAAGGLGGVLIGSELGGGGTGANIGSSAGALIGSIWGPLGSLIGGALGGLVGGLFDKDNPPKLSVGGNATAFDEFATGLDSTFKTLFGETFLRTKRIDDAAVKGIVDAITQFDEAFSFLDIDQIAGVSAALKDWAVKMEDSAISVEELLKSRFAAILSTFSEEIQTFVNGAEDLENQINRLQVGTAAEKLFAANPDIFGQRTVTEFLTVVAAFQDGTETIIDAFNEVVMLLDIIVSTTKALSSFAGSDLAGDFSALLALQSESAIDTVSRLNSEVLDLITGFDGSVGSLVAIGAKVQDIRAAEIAALTEIDAIQKGIAANLGNLRKDIVGIIEGPKSAGDLLNEARNLYRALDSASTPQEIAAISAEFETLIRAIDQGDVAKFSGEILSLIDNFQAAADRQLELAEQNVIDNAQAMRDAVGDFLTGLGDPLSFIAETNERAAAALEILATGSEDTGKNESITENIVSAIQSGFQGANVNVYVTVEQPENLVNQ